MTNACNGGKITFSTCSMHMQLGVTYHIPKGASKNGLPVKETFNIMAFSCRKLQEGCYNVSSLIAPQRSLLALDSWLLGAGIKALGRPSNWLTRTTSKAFKRGSRSKEILKRLGMHPMHLCVRIRNSLSLLALLASK